ncbi:hypothetical protein DFJ58DRAFT_849004 [Suillus subalutaceus]|uniref:uncharacterized protein n=1 Tax=Suillus subalutaceus TaxID=48586 RepID=UPI001B85CDDE|nr:uncharacterized protein DFJ58DRAFT_849004 [Suillus subalutaceus]KAG1828598.1 hypothetical protein DFJ58DRAFT_849004 [Suillus subalutaceus]
MRQSRPRVFLHVAKSLQNGRTATRAKYAAKNDSIRTEVQEKHQEALTNWKEKQELARAGFVQDVEQEEKIRAFNELEAHLDHVFRHLSHKTGGLNSPVLLEDRTQPQLPSQRDGGGERVFTYCSNISPYYTSGRTCIISRMIRASGPWAEGRYILDCDGWAGSVIIPDGDGWAQVGNM